MSETITIQVSVEDAKALASLNNLQNIVDKLNKSAVKISANVVGGNGNDGWGKGGNTAFQFTEAVSGMEKLSTATKKYGDTVKVVDKYQKDLDTTVTQTSKNGHAVAETIKKDYTAVPKIIDKATESATKLGTSIGKTLSKITEVEHLYPKGTFNDVAKGLTEAQSKLAEANENFKQSGDVVAYKDAIKGIGKEVGDLNNQFQNLLPQQSRLTKLLGDSLDNIIAKIAAWQIINAAVATTIRSIKEAAQTIKEVDSELATIRKVTGMSESEAASLGESSYGVASKYGVSANEYLQSVATYAKAGYKETAESLGELAIKTQLVGDTTTDIANQFLLSTDATWKYKGNIQALSMVLDEANVIDNNYATSIEKIAEGMPIVASVAAMATMSTEETMAALGTITATTQESGTKAATALRAIILNILGDTTTEIEEGVTATSESVNTLGTIIDKYTDGAWSAAKATGELLNPMEAIAALAQADLSKADLFQIVEALGGKLRANQLQALLDNFDMYSEMLEKMGTAAGSADKEIEVMLDTWERKTQILQNTWTQFISHLTDTGAIKGALDVLTGAIKLLDSGFTKFAFTVATVTAAGAGVIPIIGGIGKKIIALSLSMGPLAAGASTAGAAVRALTASLLANPLFWVAAGTVAIYGTVKAVDALTVSFEEQQEKVAGLSSELETYKNELETLQSKTDLSAAEANRLKVLQGIVAAKEAELKIEQELAYRKWQQEGGGSKSGSFESEYGSKYNSSYQTASLSARLVEQARTIEASARRSLYGGAISTEEFSAKISSAMSAMSDTYEVLQSIVKAGTKLDPEDQKLVDYYEFLAKVMGSIAEKAEDAKDPLEDLNNGFENQADALNAATQSVKDYKAALENLTDFEKNASEIASGYNALIEDFNAGKLNTPSILSFIDKYISQNTQAKYGYNAKSIIENELINGTVGRLLSASDPGLEMFNLITEKVSNGEISDAIVRMNGNVIEYISSYEELANALDLTVGLTQALVEENNAFWDGTLLTAEQADDYWKTVANNLGSTANTFELNTDNVKQFASEMKNLTKAATGLDLANTIEGVLKSKGLQFTDSFIETLNESIAELYGGEPVMIEGSISMNGAGEAAKEVGEVAQNANEVPKEINTKVQQTGAKETNDAVKKVSDAVDNLDGNSATVSVYASDGASGVINRISALLNSLNGRRATVFIDAKGSGTSMSVGAQAKGTEYAEGGLTLVNDGTPVNGSAQELIVDSKGAYIANNGEMALVNLERGAKVYTAEETAEMLNGSAKRIQSFAGGSYTRQSISSGTAGAREARDYSSGSQTPGSKVSENVNDILQNLDKQIKLAQNRNDTALEQQLQDEAIKIVKQYVDQMFAKGLTLKDDEVLDLLNKGYGYSNDLMNELVDSLEALTNATDKANSLAEKQTAVEEARTALENVSNQRTVRVFNPVTGQWEWVANGKEIESAQKNLADAEKKLQEEQVSQELAAIKKAGIGDIESLMVGQGITSLINSATPAEQQRIADILKAITGGVANSLDTDGQSIFTSSDSHDTVYQFGNITLTDEQASSMTVKQLAGYIRELSVT